MPPDSVIDADAPQTTVAPPSRWTWSVRDVMTATAVVAVLLAGWRVEVMGAHGAGLVPACSFLISCTWFRDALKARKAAGRPAGYAWKVAAGSLALVIGATIVVLADFLFVVIASCLGLTDAIRWLHLCLSEGTVPELAGLIVAGCVAAASIVPPLIAASRMRRHCWGPILRSMVRGVDKTDEGPQPATMPLESGPGLQSFPR